MQDIAIEFLVSVLAEVIGALIVYAIMKSFDE